MLQKHLNDVCVFDKRFQNNCRAVSCVCHNIANEIAVNRILLYKQSHLSQKPSKKAFLAAAAAAVFF